jgi:AcrR family transcriptional regulator
MPRIVDKTARRAGLIKAAARVFAKNGVANTTVSDVAKAASVAQGTIYLYFKDKDDIILGVVENMVARMMDEIEHLLLSSGTSAVEKLRALGVLLGSTNFEPHVAELVEILHRPENRVLHDRMAEHLTPRLVSVMESIIRQGFQEGSFTVPDPRAAAWFVLGGLQSVELSGTKLNEMPAAIEAVTGLALRALGLKEDPS